MITRIELTQQEVAFLMQLCNLACGQGSQVARVAIAFEDKLVAAVEASKNELKEAA